MKLRRYFSIITRTTIVLLVIFTFPQIAGAQVKIESHIFKSTVLDKKVRYIVCLPENYYDSENLYPVIFMLHGFDGEGSNWIQLAHAGRTVDSLEKTGVLPPVILIMPDAGNSYYINNYDHSLRYEDFLINEFLPFVNSAYRVKPGKDNHVLMGLSMGGYGAVVLGIKHPDHFGSVAAFSAAVRTDSMMKNLSDVRYNLLFKNVFGPAPTHEARLTQQWKENSPYYLVSNANAPDLRQIHWYIECGTEDSLFPASQALDQLFSRYYIGHKFVARPGEHNWNFWHDATIHGLVYLAPFLSIP